MIEKIISLLIGKQIRREKVEWTGIKTQEGKNEFINLLYATYPAAERIYQGRYGVGMPTPTPFLEELEAKKKSNYL